jgi:hypothetical protein
MFCNESLQVADSVTHIIRFGTWLGETVEFRAQGVAPWGCVNGQSWCSKDDFVLGYGFVIETLNYTFLQENYGRKAIG